MAEMDRNIRPEAANLEGASIETKRPGVDYPVGLELNGRPVVLAKGEVLEEGRFYPPAHQHELPKGFAWVGPEGGDRQLFMGRMADPRPTKIEVAGQMLEVGKVYSSVTQSHPLPEGYKWSLMMYGLDYTRQGVNRMLLFQETEE